MRTTHNTRLALKAQARRARFQNKTSRPSRTPEKKEDLTVEIPKRIRGPKRG